MTNYLRSNMDDFVTDKDAPKDAEAEVDELMQLDVVIDREAVQEIISKEIVPDLSNVEVIEAPSDTDEDEPDVEDIKDPKIFEDNHCGCVMPRNSRLDALREVFDEETCADVLIGYYEACKSMELDPDETKADFFGCEFDYTSNTYRLHVTLSAGSVTIGENFMVIKVDGATGHPKICSIR